MLTLARVPRANLLRAAPRLVRAASGRNTAPEASGPLFPKVEPRKDSSGPLFKPHPNAPPNYVRRGSGADIKVTGSAPQAPHAAERKKMAGSGSFNALRDNDGRN